MTNQLKNKHNNFLDLEPSAIQSDMNIASDIARESVSDLSNDLSTLDSHSSMDMDAPATRMTTIKRSAKAFVFTMAGLIGLKVL